MKKKYLLLLPFFFIGCKKTVFPEVENNIDDRISEIVHSEKQNFTTINKEKNTIIERFDAPKNYQWVESPSNSYGNFIEHFSLKKFGSPILKFNGQEIGNQNLHVAVFDIDVGDKDLQQCADAVIRLYSEYLYKTKQFDKIKFHFTSGDLLTWNNYKNGTRAFVNGNSVSFRRTENSNDSYENFRNYLNLIFNYAGTISVNRETKAIIKNSELQTGDILITPGSPGHVVFIAGVSKNSKGKKLYLLGEGFTPAQSISIMKNPYKPSISPWYELDVNAEKIETSRYYFKPVNFRRY